MKIKITSLVLDLIVIVSLVFLSGCSKNSDTNSANIIPQPRTTNSFGQALPQNVSCRVTKAYESSPDTATYLYYDANGLLTKMVDKEGTTQVDQTLFSYDNGNRLIKITLDNGTTEFVFDYGTSVNKVQKIITNYMLIPARHDTAFFSYPDANKIVCSITDYSISDFRRDTLEFDNNYNLVKQTEFGGPVGGAIVLQLRRTVSFNSSVKSFTFPSALNDFLIMLNATEGASGLPSGKDLFSEVFYYDYSIVPNLAEHYLIQDIQLNTNGYPTYFKQKDVINNIVTSITRLEYECN